MKNKDLQKLLAQYPDNMPVRLLLNQNPYSEHVDLTEDHILRTSEGAYVDDEADPNTWDCEDGKIRDKGKKYLLFNPIIV